MYLVGRIQNYVIAVSAENYFNTHHLSFIRNLLLFSLGVAVFFIALMYPI